MTYEPGRGDNLPSSGIVAFTAKLKADDSYPCHTGVLRFGTVLVNEGGGYSRDTGVFTCPMDGFYHITIHVSVYGRGQCALLKNAEKVVSLYHTTLPDKCSQVASMSSVIKLSKKDEVHVHIFGPGKNDIFASEDNDTVFTGVRLG
ncbi:complement C1q and tumor necrosis factor-related protein 9-like isoform X2 [Sebastes umbrosus]|uniref:complement C1q and tumor necrosis factor-related protein 9-like isoform X2 n=1 Tax=Sebastes umbrosus TaxID=72105 RepID=UPI00189E281B|nr:complement C1q and tumor necrosis factor-related protein 9-like isoform X2 [Sebastes umbrosus]